MLCRIQVCLLAACCAACGTEEPTNNNVTGRERLPEALPGLPRPDGSRRTTMVLNGVTLSSVQLRGDVGPARELDSIPSRVEGYAEEDVLEVTAFAPAGSGLEGMVRLTLGGGLPQPALTPGRLTTLRAVDGMRDGRLYARVLGCVADPQTGEWLFDEPADEVDVVAAEGSTPDHMLVEFTARWNRSGAPQEVSGQFDVTLTPALQSGWGPVVVDGQVDGELADKLSASADSLSLVARVGRGDTLVDVEFLGGRHQVPLPEGTVLSQFAFGDESLLSSMVRIWVWENGARSLAWKVDSVSAQDQNGNVQWTLRAYVTGRDQPIRVSLVMPLAR